MIPVDLSTKRWVRSMISYDPGSKLLGSDLGSRSRDQPPCLVTSAPAAARKHVSSSSPRPLPVTHPPLLSRRHCLRRRPPPLLPQMDHGCSPRASHRAPSSLHNNPVRRTIDRRRGGIPGPCRLPREVQLARLSGGGRAFRRPPLVFGYRPRAYHHYHRKCMLSVTFQPFGRWQCPTTSAKSPKKSQKSKAKSKKKSKRASKVRTVGILSVAHKRSHGLFVSRLARRLNHT